MSYGNIERINNGRTLCYQHSHSVDDEQYARISVDNLRIPKFTMQLAANQGNPKQLAALLAAQRMKKKRFLRAMEDDDEKAAVDRPEYTKTAKNQCIFEDNQQEFKIYLQGVQQSSLCRRRMENRKREPSLAVCGPREMDLTKTPRDRSEMVQDSLQSRFQEKVRGYSPVSPQTTPPRDHFEMVSSFEELVVIQSPRERARSKTGLD